MSVLAVGDQRRPPGVQVIPRGVGLGHSQVVGVEVYTDHAQPTVGGYLHIRQLSGGEHPPAPGVPLEPVADGLSQTGGPSRLLAVLAPVPGVVGIAPKAASTCSFP